MNGGKREDELRSQCSSNEVINSEFKIHVKSEFIKSDEPEKRATKQNTKIYKSTTRKKQQTKITDGINVKDFKIHGTTKEQSRELTEKELESLNEKYPVVVEFLLFMRAKEYKKIDEEKFKNVAILHNDQIASYKKVENIRVFRSGDQPFDVVAKNTEFQSNYYTEALKNNKSPEKDNFVRIGFDFFEKMDSINFKHTFATYDEVKVKKIVLKCLDCYFKDSCCKHLNSPVEEINDIQNATKNFNDLTREQYIEDIKTLFFDQKKKLMGYSDNGKRNIPGSILYKAAKIWSMVTKWKGVCGHLLMMTKATEDTIEFLYLGSFEHKVDYKNMFYEISNRFQSLVSPDRWNDLMKPDPEKDDDNTVRITTDPKSGLCWSLKISKI